MTRKTPRLESLGRAGTAAVLLLAAAGIAIATMVSPFGMAQGENAERTANKLVMAATETQKSETSETTVHEPTTCRSQSVSTQTINVLTSGLPMTTPNIGRPFTFTGTVTDNNKTPIDAATVCTQFWEGPDFVNGRGATTPEKCISEHFTQTNRQGEYSVALPQELVGKSPLYVCIRAGHPDFISRGVASYPIDELIAAHELSQADGTDCHLGDFALVPAAHLRGVVLSPTETPLANVLIRTYSRSAIGDSLYAATDHNGEFGIRVHRDVPIVLWAIPSDFAPVAMAFDKAPTDPVVVDVKPGIVLKGRLEDRNGAPMAGIWIDAVEKESLAVYPQDRIIRNAMTDADGQFSLAPLTEGTYCVEPTHEPMDPLTYFDGTRTSDFGMEGVYTISDRKRDASREPVPRSAPHNEVYSSCDVTLAADTASLVIRPVPSVTITGQIASSAGEVCGGDLMAYIVGKIDGQIWGEFQHPIRISGDGQFSMAVPRGLCHAILHCGTKENDKNRPIRFRRGLTGTEQTDWCIEFPKLDANVDDLYIKVLQPACLRVAVCVEESFMPESASVQIQYQRGSLFKDDDHGSFGFVQGFGKSHLFEHEEVDGKLVRWMPYAVLPGEPFTVTAKVLQETASETLTLREGETRSVILEVR
ncbi:MAG: carboxypeptidase-like regulatory domain-containing protein [Thermoguttaceae bacterium]